VGFIILNIALTDDLQRLVRARVENGQFPNEQAVIEGALRVFLVEQPDLGKDPTSFAKVLRDQCDEDARPWRGVYAVEFPEDVLFTKPINVRPEQLDEWLPQGVTSDRRFRDEDE
jgi:hypothetical protein